MKEDKCDHYLGALFFEYGDIRMARYVLESEYKKMSDEKRQLIVSRFDFCPRCGEELTDNTRRKHE